MNDASDNKWIPNDILDDLCCRFIINIPECERSDPIRLFFQIELAHWFYIDFHRVENAKLKKCGMKKFARQILKHIPEFESWIPELDALYEKWREYKVSVPTYGGIILNDDMTKVLLVQSYHYTWGFPKGKVNQDENPANCAAREIWEETGCDVSDLLNPDVYLEACLLERRIRLYVIHGVDESIEFKPQTRNEVKSVRWFNINDLPTGKNEGKPFRTSSFFTVMPFIRKIKNWVQENCEVPASPKPRQRHKSVGDQASTPFSPGLSLLSPLSNIKLSKGNRRSAKSQQRNQLRLQNYYKLKNQSGSDMDYGNDQAYVNAQVEDVKPITPKMIIRRQLFAAPEESKVAPTKIIVPSWLNFKLDRESLLKCFDI